MRVLFVETFYTGSHRYFIDRWIAHTRHEYRLVTLPGRFWKWRQAGAALRLAESLPEDRFDAIVIGGMIDLAQLIALRPDLPPVILYIHENQFSYPMSPGEERDFRYGLVDLVNVRIAAGSIFNSRYNRDTLFSGARALLDRLPDAIPQTLLESAERKTSVVCPGIDAKEILSAIPKSPSTPSTFPQVVWNHRHEHDKNPEAAFSVLEELADDGVDFELLILGERFDRRPEVFERVSRTLSRQIVFDGYPGRREYLGCLAGADIVLSTADQENFGISVAEAVCAGCWPLLPRRLAYPELLPVWAHGSCLWSSLEDFKGKLRYLLSLSKTQRNKLTRPLSQWFMGYDWSKQADILDDEVERIASSD